MNHWSFHSNVLDRSELIASCSDRISLCAIFFDNQLHEVVHHICIYNVVDMHLTFTCPN